MNKKQIKKVIREESERFLKLSHKYADAKYTIAQLENKIKDLEKETHPLWRSIIQSLTVGETYFFRNQAHLKALRDSVLPDLIARRRKVGGRHLRIWSAGCATGEEPYTIAMMLHDLLPDIEAWSIDLLATDINEEFLLNNNNKLKSI